MLKSTPLKSTQQDLADFFIVVNRTTPKGGKTPDLCLTVYKIG